MLKIKYIGVQRNEKRISDPTALFLEGRLDGQITAYNPKKDNPNRVLLIFQILLLRLINGAKI